MDVLSKGVGYPSGNSFLVYLLSAVGTALVVFDPLLEAFLVENMATWQFGVFLIFVDYLVLGLRVVKLRLLQNLGRIS